MNRVLYINNKKHMAQPADGVTYVDHPALPGRCSACHRIDKGDWLAMEAGARIYTGGNWYSLHPNREEAPKGEAQDHLGTGALALQ